MLIDIATSSPPYKILQPKATEELKKRMAIRPAIGRLIDAASVNSGIESRYIVIPDAEEEADKKFYSNNGSYVEPDTKLRMNEYENWSRILSYEAVEKLFKENKIEFRDIQRLITVSCTGFFAPGIDYYLIDKFNLPRNIKRTNIGFMGCAASITGFNSVLEALHSAGEKDINTLLVSVELCSIHLQAEPTRDNILANIIFADGCAAAFFSNSERYTSRKKLDLLGTYSMLFNNSLDFMGWKIGNKGFEMILSPELPKIIMNEAVPSLLNILKEQGIAKEEIKHWALHPGGRAILDSLQEGLNLSDNEMLPSRTVLKNFGNMSSVSILFVLKEIMNNSNVKKDELCCAVAFGPGLTMEVALLRGA